MDEDPTLSLESAPISLLTLVDPASDEDVIEASDPTFTAVAQARPGAVVSVDGDLVDLAADGSFSSTVLLEDGLNTIEVVATDPGTEEEARATFLVVLGE